MAIICCSIVDSLWTGVDGVFNGLMLFGMIVSICITVMYIIDIKSKFNEVIVSKVEVIMYIFIAILLCAITAKLMVYLDTTKQVIPKNKSPDVNALRAAVVSNIYLYKFIIKMLTTWLKFL